MNARTRSLIALTIVPTALVGGLLWWFTGLVPECTNTQESRLDSPDAGKSVVIFTRDCGSGGLNTQAVVMPAGGTLEGDATGFLALEGRQALDTRWDAYGNLEVTIPPGAEVVQQQDEAGGVAIIYR